MSNASIPAKAAKGELLRAFRSVLALVLDWNNCELRRELRALSTPQFRAEEVIVLEWDDRSYAREMGRNHKPFENLRERIQSAMARSNNWDSEIKPLLDGMKRHSLKPRWGLIITSTPVPPAEASNILQSEFARLTPADVIMMIWCGIKWDERRLSERKF
jgi:hypothetical protein